MNREEKVPFYSFVCYLKGMVPEDAVAINHLKDKQQVNKAEDGGLDLIFMCVNNVLFFF